MMIVVAVRVEFVRSLLYRTIYLVLGPLQTGADRY